MSIGVWIFCMIIAGFTIWALMDMIKRIRWNIRKNRELGLNWWKGQQARKNMDKAPKE